MKTICKDTVSKNLFSSICVDNFIQLKCVVFSLSSQYHFPNRILVNELSYLFFSWSQNIIFSFVVDQSCINTFSTTCSSCCQEIAIGRLINIEARQREKEKK